MRIKKNKRLITIIICLLISCSACFAGNDTEKKEFEQNMDLFRKNDFRKAYRGFKNFKEKYPSSIYLSEVYFHLASLETNYYTAIIFYKEMIEKYPQDKLTDEALYRLAKLYFIHDNYTEAIRIFKNLINDFPKSGFIYGSKYYLGLVHLVKNDFSDAVSYFDRVINMNKKDRFHVLAVIGKADCYFEQKDFGKSAYYFKEGLKFKDKNYFPSIYLGLGNSYLKQKNYDKAYYYFRKAVKEFPGSPEYELALEKINYIKDNKTIFDSIDWSKFKADERPQKEKPDRIYYAVQIASVQNVRYANDWRIKIKSAGYETFMEQIDTDKGIFYRTVVGKYEKREEADKARTDIERKFKLKGTIIELK